MRRFVIPPDAIEGSRVRFPADQARHLGRVLRLGPGAVVEATDGAGRVFRVRLDHVDAAAARGTILGDAGVPSESPCAITLAHAVLRTEPMAWLVQKATELGVSRIVPLETARVVARAPAGRAEARRARWERIAREAVKQCGRAVAPAVEGPRSLADLLSEAGRHDAAWLLWEGGGTPLGRIARAAGRPRRLLLVVGPEGGFTAEEVARAEAAGLVPVSLGPRTLRAESAGLVALALCQHLFGDLGTDPEP
jgi:16S rRNA (uracil1498-N3)-methyltransferase